MCKVQMLRAAVNQRLTAAAEEIFGLFERTIAEYEEQLCRSKEENERQRKLLEAVFRPELRLHRADVQQLLGSKEEVPPEQQEWSPSLDQEDPPEPPHIKEEQEELWTSQEGEQLRGLEEADITEFPFTPGLNSLQNNKMPLRDEEYNTGKTSSRSSESAPSFGHKGQKHNGVQTGKKPFSCGRRYGSETSLATHMRLHSEGKYFSCSVCKKNFNRKADFVKHMRIHAGEKPFSCSVCGIRFRQGGTLRRHMTVHTGEKRFSCNICGKRFTQPYKVNNYLCG